MPERISYIHLRLTILIVKFLCSVLCLWFSIFKPKKSRDLILFPHAQPGSTGYKIRFEEYYSFLKSDSVDFNVAINTTENEEFRAFSSSNAVRYRFIRKCLLARFRQVSRAGKYKIAFVQRGLFLFYYDENTAFLEKLLKKLVDRVIVDYWDAVWFRNPALLKDTVKYASSVTVVNDFLLEFFNSLHKNVTLFPIGVNITGYKAKQNYSIKDKVVLIYTGMPPNVEVFLEIIVPVLRRFGEKKDYILRIVSKARIFPENINIEYFDFDYNTFPDLLAESDIGLFAVDNSDYSKGKMAMKVLDYMASGLPVIASPYGLSPCIEDRKNILLADTEDLWIESLIYLTENASVREQIGKNALKCIENFHNLHDSYLLFKKIILTA